MVRNLNKKDSFKVDMVYALMQASRIKIGSTKLCVNKLCRDRLLVVRSKNEFFVF